MFYDYHAKIFPVDDHAEIFPVYDNAEYTIYLYSNLQDIDNGMRVANVVPPRDMLSFENNDPSISLDPSTNERWRAYVDENELDTEDAVLMRRVWWEFYILNQHEA